jgi:hypothetical protein
LALITVMLLLWWKYNWFVNYEPSVAADSFGSAFGTFWFAHIFDNGIEKQNPFWHRCAEKSVSLWGGEIDCGFKYKAGKSVVSDRKDQNDRNLGEE